MADADVRSLLHHTAELAGAYLTALDRGPVGHRSSREELRAALDGPVPEDGAEPVRVVEELVRDVAGGLLGSAGGRFFGWAIGGTVPAALAADWLTSAWDQNAALYACSPAAAVVEEVCGAWLLELLGLPAEASVAFVTGTQLAHVTALAAARGKLLRERGWDVERQGLSGAPPIRVLTAGHQHGSIDRAVRVLGLGTESIRAVGADARGRIDLAGLERELRARDVPTIVCLQAGNLDTGEFDPFEPACLLAREHGAWVHVDGAFGLWAAVSPRHRELLAGVGLADSWTTDGHKWLNLPFDSGFAIIAHPAAHRAAMSFRAGYLIHADDARDQLDWNPEWSRRARGFACYAAIRSLGRQGLQDLVERCCAHAERLVTEIGALPGAQILSGPRLNQGLVRFRAADGAHDDRTDTVIARIQGEGTTWFGGTTWNGVRAMRVSVLNWRTTERDVERAIAAVRAALSHS
ncbi:pyridoxal-dependent decarboxylase [Saccharothrix sp. AJ9571]|nr:pyridoxal-dependent decarboxylase [Saccharothrix sp. AJ9571]